MEGQAIGFQRTDLTNAEGGLKTERIVGNWWYYEVTSHLDPSSRRTWLLP